MTPTFLTVEELLEIQRDQIDRYGGTHGVRDPGLLESAAAQPQARFSGEFLHADLFEMAAAHLFHLTSNHPFLDGNKRIGAAAALIFLELNDIEVEITEDELVDRVLVVARGEAEKAAVADFFRRRAVAPPQP